MTRPISQDRSTTQLGPCGCASSPLTRDLRRATVTKAMNVTKGKARERAARVTAALAKAAATPAAAGGHSSTGGGDPVSEPFEVWREPRKTAELRAAVSAKPIGERRLLVAHGTGASTEAPSARPTAGPKLPTGGATSGPNLPKGGATRQFTSEGIAVPSLPLSPNGNLLHSICSSIAAASPSTQAKALSVVGSAIAEAGGSTAGTSTFLIEPSIDFSFAFVAGWFTTLSVA